jgi:hypothetical protein
MSLLARLMGAMVLLLPPGFSGAAPVAAAELLMFEQPGCSWCRRFDAEIGPIYAKTDEGRQAPLRRVGLGADTAPVVLATPVRFTPTFVLVDDGREIGRITGYMSEEAFWGLLGGLTGRLASGS